MSVITKSQQAGRSQMLASSLIAEAMVKQHYDRERKKDLVYSATPSFATH